MIEVKVISMIEDPRDIRDRPPSQMSLAVSWARIASIAALVLCALVAMLFVESKMLLDTLTVFVAAVIVFAPVTRFKKTVTGSSESSNQKKSSG